MTRCRTANSANHHRIPAGKNAAPRGARGPLHHRRLQAPPSPSHPCALGSSPAHAPHLYKSSLSYCLPPFPPQTPAGPFAPSANPLLSSNRLLAVRTMAAAGVSDLRWCGGCEARRAAPPVFRVPRTAGLRILRCPQDGMSNNVSLLGTSKRLPLVAHPKLCCTRMALVEHMPIADYGATTRSAEILAYDLVQGSLVASSSSIYKSDPPTAVLLHGILGCRKNWGSFARRLAQEFPMWQFLLVDLRCHGESASLKTRGSHTVASAALDVLKLVRQLRLTPRVLVGHSFGGKVALSMVEQAAKPLARPVKVWVLDATPGKVRPGGHGEDRPAELINFLSKMPEQIPSKKLVIEALIRDGFSEDVAQWVATNLRRSGYAGSSGFSWVFDLKGISDMFNSYEETNLWNVVEDVPRGVHINFLKAERSLHRWALEDIQRIHAAEEVAADEAAGVQMHFLEDAGHWVHADNPDGLFRILSSSFQSLR